MYHFEVASFNDCRKKSRGPKFLQCTLAHTPASFCHKSCLSVLPKPKLYNKFELASFGGCKNKYEGPKFSLDVPLLISVVKLVSRQVTPQAQVVYQI